jgi:hypothetical protein
MGARIEQKDWIIYGCNGRSLDRIAGRRCQRQVRIVKMSEVAKVDGRRLSVDVAIIGYASRAMITLVSSPSML